MDAADDIPWDTFVLPSSDAPGLLADAANDLERTFFGNPGRPVHKWLHYLPVYDAHFSRFRDTEFRMLAEAARELTGWSPILDRHLASAGFSAERPR